MANLNMANRKTADLIIKELGSEEVFLYADFCNTTTAGFSSDKTFANIKGQKAISYDNPIEGTMKMTFQCKPIKVFSLLAGGQIKTSAIVPIVQDITCSTDGSLTIDENAVVGSVFVYAQGDVGGTKIDGAFAAGTFTPTTAEDIVLGTTYTVTYMLTKSTGVKKVEFNDKVANKDYVITQVTEDKNEAGDIIPVYMTAYKASPKRSLELSFASGGDVAEITVEFDCMRDKDGNVIDYVACEE